MTICFILTAFGLWKYVKRGESCQVAATVDGGQLSWKVTQISAGIKLINASDGGSVTIQAEYVRT